MIQRAVWLACDAQGPDCESEYDSWELTAEISREQARLEGWHYRPGGRDICPACWEAGLR